MKLILKNFLCHAQASFTIPESGFHKLSGMHGAGKSTIYASIYYALYGKLFRKVKTPYSFGKKDCSVTLESEGLWINRTSGKKSLTVKVNGVKYIDDAAQSVINSFIGMDGDEFLLSSYIVQNGSGSESILKLTPAKKLEFFEKLVYRGNAVQTFQEKIKAKKLELDHQHATLTGKKQAYEKQIEDFESHDTSPVEDPGEKSSTIQQELNSLNRKVTQLGTDMATIRTEITRSENDRKLLIKLESDLESLSKEASLEAPEDVSEMLDAKELELGQHLSKAGMEKDIRKLESSIVEVSDFLDDAGIKQIKDELDVHHSLYQNFLIYEQTQAALAKTNEDIKRTFMEVKVSFGFFKKTMTAELLALKRMLGTRGLVCPCCKKKVDFVEGVLKTSDADQPPQEFSRNDVTKYIKTLETLALKKDELKDTLSKLPPPEENSYLDILGVYEQEVKKTEQAKNVRIVENKIQNLRTQIEILNLTSTEEEVRASLNKLRETSYERTSILKRKSQAASSIKNIKEKVKDIQVRLEDASKFGGEEKLRELEMQRERLTSKRSDLSSRLETALRYETTNALYEKYQNALSHLEEVSSAIEEVEESMKGVKELERKGKEARLLALYESIENINARALIYLRELFEDPITITLIPVTPTGTQKIQIDTKINFKNNEYGDFGEFSGGETQLAELAFMLAINDAIGSRFLFLDECLNNLHQDSNVDILNYLKGKASERLILVVSHESSDGVFDSIIQVG